MKKKFLFVILILLFPAIVWAWGTVIISGNVSSESSWPDFTYDVYEDFEDALNGNWSETDSTNCDGGASECLDPNNSTQSNRGTYSGQLDSDSGAANYFTYNSGSAQTHVSAGFAVYIPTQTSSLYVYAFAYGESNPTNNIVRAQWYYNGSAYAVRLRGVAYSANVKTITSSVPGWFWITVDVQDNDTCTLRVYALPSEAEIDAGISVTCTGNDRVDASLGYYHLESVSGSAAVDIDSYIDDFVADWTDATFPLGP